MESKKQSKAEKRLYAAIRHSKKLDKQGTKQGGYWRDIKSRQSEYQIEQERESLRKASKGLTKGAQSFHQEHGIAIPGTLVSRLARGQTGRELSAIEHGRQLLFAGQRPGYGRKPISGYRRAAKEYLAAMPLSFGGSVAMAKASRKTARREAKRWGLNPYDDVTLALILLHGPGHAESISKAIDGMAASLYCPESEGRTDGNVGYTARRISVHISSRVNDDGPGGYLHCRDSRIAIDCLLSWCEALIA